MRARYHAVIDIYLLARDKFRASENVSKNQPTCRYRLGARLGGTRGARGIYRFLSNFEINSTFWRKLDKTYFGMCFGGIL